MDAGAALAPPAPALRPRRADRLLDLGALPLLLRQPRLGGPRPQPAQPLLVRDDRYRRGRTSTTTSRTSSRSWTSSGHNAVAVGHGMGGLLALKAAERIPVGAIVLLDSELPRDLRPAVRPHELREIPDVYGRDLDRLGDAAREAAAGEPRPDHRRHRPAAAPVRAEAARLGSGQARDPRRHRRSTARASPACRCWSWGRAWTAPRPRPEPSAWPTGWAASTSRSGPIPTTAWSSASRATSRSAEGVPVPFLESPPACYGVGVAGESRGRCAGGDPPVQPRDSELARSAGSCYHPARPAPRRPARCRIRLEAQDTALSRLRSSVRIRYAVPTRRYLTPPDRAPGAFLFVPPSVRRTP